MTQLVEKMVQKIMELPDVEQDQIAMEVLKRMENSKTPNPNRNLSETLLMPILDDEDEQLFQRNRDTARQVDL